MKATKYIFKITVSLSVIKKTVWREQLHDGFYHVYASLNKFVCILPKNINTFQNSNNAFFRVQPPTTSSKK